MDAQVIKELVSPIDKVATCTQGEKLGTALSLLDSSNEAVFVTDERENFLGLVSPIYTIYKKRHPFTTKVETVLTHPPFLTEESKVKDVLEDMFNLRIFQLPVFEKGTKKKKVIGGIFLKDIFTAFEKQVLTLSEEINLDKIYSVEEHKLTEEIFSDFRSLKVTDVAVVDKSGKLVGLVTRKDLQASYIHPSNRQRFHKDADVRADNISFDSEQSYRWQEKILKHESKNLFVLNRDLDKKEMVKKLIESSFYDAVVTDESNRPIGILTSEGILKTILKEQQVSNFEIKFERPSRSVSDKEFNDSIEILTSFGKKITKMIPLQRLEVKIEEPKYSTQKTVVYNTLIKSYHNHGKFYIAHSKKKDFLRSIREAINQIHKQYRRERDQLGHHIAVSFP